jgi:hypothetical protein
MADCVNMVVGLLQILSQYYIQYFDTFGGNEGTQSKEIDLLQHMCNIWWTQGDANHRGYTSGKFFFAGHSKSSKMMPAD